ncbi:uncharacterized protein SCODWIG_01394 [Saccharomycodes ludwigii]|uniref:Cell division control protein 25 n=1 Tax=Saccharomycodes ludwigii TaxID=36035 RepID=A0A376B4P1_9ASCO|nr:uncharacterized protein SCODWIG_01394 [Saccharomycodes ludwigii]
MNNRSSISTGSNSSDNKTTTTADINTASPVTHPPNMIIKPIDIVIAAFDFTSNSMSTSGINYLYFKEGQVIYVLNKDNNNLWWDGIIVINNNANEDLIRGWFPGNFTKPLYNNKNNNFSATSNPNLHHHKISSSLHYLSKYKYGNSTSRKNSIISNNSNASSSHHSSSSQQQHNNPINTTTHTKYRETSPFSTSSSSSSSASLPVSASIKNNLNSSTSTNINTDNTSKKNDSNQEQHKQKMKILTENEIRNLISNLSPSIANTTLKDNTSLMCGGASVNNNYIDNSGINSGFSKSDKYNDTGSNSSNTSNALSGMNNPVLIWVPVPVKEIYNSNDKSNDNFGGTGYTEDGTKNEKNTSYSSPKILYYNKLLDVYCKKLPFVDYPELNNNSLFPTDENDVDLSVRLLTKDEDDKLKKTGNADHINSVEDDTNTSGLKKEDHDNNNNNNKDKSQTGTAITTFNSENVFLFDSSHFYCDDAKDITSWSNLHSLICFNLNMAQLHITKEPSSYMFQYHLNLVSKYSLYFHTTVRLLQKQITKAKKKEIKKLLKIIRRSFFIISVNGYLYFNSNYYNDHFKCNKNTFSSVPSSKTDHTHPCQHAEHRNITKDFNDNNRMPREPVLESHQGLNHETHFSNNEEKYEHNDATINTTDMDANGIKSSKFSSSSSSLSSSSSGGSFSNFVDARSGSDSRHFNDFDTQAINTSLLLSKSASNSVEYPHYENKKFSTSTIETLKNSHVHSNDNNIKHSASGNASFSNSSTLSTTHELNNNIGSNYSSTTATPSHTTNKNRKYSNNIANGGMYFRRISGSSSSFSHPHLLIDDLLKSVSDEFVKFQTANTQLYKVMVIISIPEDSSNTRNPDILIPQILPRFFKNDFSGGSWNDPFSKDMDRTGSTNCSSYIPFKESFFNAKHNTPYSNNNDPLGSDGVCGAGLRRDKKIGDNKLTNPNRIILNHDLLNIFKTKYGPTLLSQDEFLSIMSKPRSTERDLELTVYIRNIISTTSEIIFFLENLDISFYTKLRNLDVKRCYSSTSATTANTTINDDSKANDGTNTHMSSNMGSTYDSTRNSFSSNTSVPKHQINTNASKEEAKKQLFHPQQYYKNTDTPSVSTASSSSSFSCLQQPSSADTKTALEPSPSYQTTSTSSFSNIGHSISNLFRSTNTSKTNNAASNNASGVNDDANCGDGKGNDTNNANDSIDENSTPEDQDYLELTKWKQQMLELLSGIIMDFCEVKQAFHDVVIRGVIDAQNITLKDPYTFSSMKGELSYDSILSAHRLSEDIQQRSNFRYNKINNSQNATSNVKYPLLSHTKINTTLAVLAGHRNDSAFLQRRNYRHAKRDKITEDLKTHLIKQDVETSDSDFWDCDESIKKFYFKLLDIYYYCTTVLEQLVVAKENFLNNVFRNMNNELLASIFKYEFEDQQLQQQQQQLQHHQLIDDEIDTFLLHKDIISEEGGGKKPMGGTSILIREDQPWFLQSDYDSQLIYDDKGFIKAGTKEALIEHLTSHKTVDRFFIVVFLTTFRSMLTCNDLLRSLLERYNLPPPEGLSYEQYNSWVEKKMIPIKEAVMNVVLIFLSDYWCPAYYEPGVEDIKILADVALTEKTKHAEEVAKLIDEKLIKCGYSNKNGNHTDKNSNMGEDHPQKSSTASVLSGGLSSTPSVVSSTKLNLPLNKPSNSPSPHSMGTIKLLDLSPSEFAEQLTVKECELYSKINTFECLDRIWGKKYCSFGGSPNIKKFISTSNHLTNYVTFQIVKLTDIQKRCSTIEFFINTAVVCRSLNNFSSMTAIISAMYSSPVYRLKNTWELVDKNIKNKLSELNVLMESFRNFARYREVLNNVTKSSEPYIPFLGVYLSDLTFISSGNPDYLRNSQNQIINFAKRIRITEILKEITNCKKRTYKLNKNTQLLNFIESYCCNNTDSNGKCIIPGIELLYNQSLIIEPRDKQQNKSLINSTNKNFNQSTKHQQYQEGSGICDELGAGSVPDKDQKKSIDKQNSHIKKSAKRLLFSNKNK